MDCKLEETVHFTVTTHNISGMRVQADETPRFYVFEENNHTPIIQYSGMSLREVGGVGFSGVYHGQFLAGTANGFDLGSYYTVLASGKVNNITAFHVPLELYVVNRSLTDMTTSTGVAYDVWEERTVSHPRGGTFGSGVNIASGQWAYFADIRFTKDTSNDEYTVDWYRNTIPVPSSEIISPTLGIIKRSDGLDLNPAASMDFVNPNIGTLKRDISTPRMTDGEAAIAKATAIIDGATRTWVKLIGRDV